jgi:hypothetical protein
MQGAQVTVPLTLTSPRGTADLQLQVTTGMRTLTYELPVSGTTVQLRVTPGNVQIAGLSPDRVQQLRKPVSGLQLTLLQKSTPSGRQHVLDQLRLGFTQNADTVRILVPGDQVGSVGRPGSTWLAFPTG